MPFGFLSNLMGASINQVNQENAQKFNAKEAEKNRQFQEAMMDKSYNQSVEFWNMQNEYNTPAQQVQRMKDAGLNPALMGGVSTGTAQGGTNTSASGAQASSTPLGVSFSGINESLRGIINNKYQQDLMRAQASEINADAQLKRIDASTRLSDNLARITAAQERARSDKSSASLAEAKRATEDAMRSVTVQGAYADVQNTQAQRMESIMRTISGFQHLSYLPKDKSLEYSEKLANIALLYQEGRESRQRVRKMIQETNESYFRGQGQKFMNDLNKKTERYLIEDRAYAPTRGFSLGGAAATIGNRIGTYLFGD